MRIQVAAGEFSEQEYGQLKPGSRVQYRGTFWKIVGMYFASATAAVSYGGPTKYLILQSMDLRLANVRAPFGTMRLP